MSAQRLTVWLVAATVLLAGWLVGGKDRLVPAQAGPTEISGDALERGLTFDPSVAAGDRAAIEAAIAAARPEARALIDRVDGLVTVKVGRPPQGSAGLTEGNAEGYTVTLDLAETLRINGPRGTSRLVLHELGHVVDHALLTPAVQASLDAGIPQGYACRPGEPTGACAPREERFAETFAKWAANDIGINIWLGYKVLPPPSLETWGAGLAGV